MEKLKEKGQPPENNKENEKEKENDLEARQKALHDSKDEIKKRVKEGQYDAKYIFSALTSVHLGAKARCFALCKKDLAQEYRVVVGLSNNSMELWNLRLTQKLDAALHIPKSGSENTEARVLKVQELGWWGHRTPIRVCALSSDDNLLLTASTGRHKLDWIECVKTWAVASFACIKQLPIENVVSALFLPGDKYAVLGSKEGFLYVVDCTSLEVVQTVEVRRMLYFLRAILLKSGVYSSTPILISLKAIAVYSQVPPIRPSNSGPSR